MQESVPFFGPEYWALLAVLVVARGADFLSTWVATPNLVLEGNPLAKRLGWRGGLVVNAVVCGVFAAWPVAAITIATTSVLVAARNFQSAWLMRTLGEEAYLCWYAERLREAPVGLYLTCLAGQVILTAVVGVVLMTLLDRSVIAFSVGFGILAYALAVALYTLLSLWRVRRALR